MLTTIDSAYLLRPLYWPARDYAYRNKARTGDPALLETILRFGADRGREAMEAALLHCQDRRREVDSDSTLIEMTNRIIETAETSEERLLAPTILLYASMYADRVRVRIGDEWLGDWWTAGSPHSCVTVSPQRSIDRFRCDFHLSFAGSGSLQAREVDLEANGEYHFSDSLQVARDRERISRLRRLGIEYTPVENYVIRRNLANVVQSVFQGLSAGELSRQVA